MRFFAKGNELGVDSYLQGALADNDGHYPASQHAEMTVLGGMLVDEEAIYTATESLTTLDFALHSHRLIFGAMLALIEDRSAVDIITIAAELRNRKELDSIGGVPYLASLTEGLPRKLSIESYARIVRDKSVLRQGMIICERGLVEMNDQATSPADIFSKMQLDLMDLMSGVDSNKVETVGSIAPRVYAKITKERENPSREDALGYTYGIPEVDRFTKGAYPNEYTIIAADTGGAKTAWLTQITLDNALKGIKSLWFSQEMNREQLTRRMFAAISELVTASDIRDPRFMGIHEYVDLGKALHTLSTLGIEIDDTKQLRLDQLIARAKAAYHRRGIKIIAVDYIQLVRSPSTARHHLSDTERIEATTLALRDLAGESKDYGVHVIGLSQYSRPQDGGRGRPDNSRAKGSSSLEQSCQNMFHLVREKNEDGSWCTDVEVRVGKQREGRFGSIQCVFDESHLRFNSKR